MIDHILSFATETDAHTALDPLGFAPEGAWDGSRVITDLRLELPDQSAVAGWHLAVALNDSDTELSAQLQAMPNCRIVTQRELAGPGVPLWQYTVYMAPTFDEQLVTRDEQGRVTSIAVVVSPVFAGSNYPF